ncbi:MAG TPA: hemerythrin domain-containing protein [Polyangiaceae bacterium]|jgi:hemerythrin-like domain-containing protein
MSERDGRRTFLTIAGAGALLAACRRDERTATQPAAATLAAAASPPDAAGLPEEGKDDVGAVEDLMREHGVIRRVLVVYRESASRLRAKPADVVPAALQKAANLMRTFGEDYHEKQLEEANIFPALSKAGGVVGASVGTLVAQHQRGREITAYVLAVTQKAIGAHAAEPLARALEGFARMYEEHAALEDTVVFPAWKKLYTPKQLDEIGDRFEDIEHKTFGKDGFDDAVDQVSAIEKSMGIELAGLTAPPPPAL